MEGHVLTNAEFNIPVREEKNRPLVFRWNPQAIRGPAQVGGDGRISSKDFKDGRGGEHPTPKIVPVAAWGKRSTVP